MTGCFASHTSPGKAGVGQRKTMGSLEEVELTAQRDAAVSLCKGLQEKVRVVSVDSAM